METKRAALVVTAGARAASCGYKPSLQATALESGFALKDHGQGRACLLQIKLLD